MTENLILVTQAELEELISIQMAVMLARKEPGAVKPPPYFVKALVARLMLCGSKSSAPSPDRCIPHRAATAARDVRPVRAHPGRPGLLDRVAHEIALIWGDTAFDVCWAEVLEADRQGNEEKADSWRVLATIRDPAQAQAKDPQPLLPGLFG